MKYLFLTGMLLLSFCMHTIAQHCPFDGSYMVLIKLTNNKEKPIAKLKDSIFLKEINNPNPEKCSFADEILNIPFGTIQNSLFNKYEGSWQSWSKRLSKECAFIKKGYYAVVLNQSQHNCMIAQKNSNDYEYEQRVFEILLKKGGKEKSLATVTNKEMYSLCTSSGSWKRINAIELVLP